MELAVQRVELLSNRWRFPLMRRGRRDVMTNRGMDSLSVETLSTMGTDT